MYGAILGDIVGSPYEFDCNNYKAKDFPLFSRRSDFTDDTVMTLAVAKALLSTRGQDDAAEVTHDHPEGIKGAQATAAAIFLARTGHDKAEIKAYVEREFGYDLSRTCDEIRPTYHHVESCQETVPQAITAFLESRDFEDALRTAVSLGGDSDTLAAITGSISEAFYGVPEELQQECHMRLTPELAEILRRWESMLYNEKICGRI